MLIKKVLSFVFKWSLKWVDKSIGVIISRKIDAYSLQQKEGIIKFPITSHSVQHFQCKFSIYRSYDNKSIF